MIKHASTFVAHESTVGMPPQLISQPLSLDLPKSAGLVKLSCVPVLLHILPLEQLQQQQLLTMKKLPHGLRVQPNDAS